MSTYTGLVIASLITALAGTLVRDKNIKLILWPAAYALMTVAMLTRS